MNILEAFYNRLTLLEEQPSEATFRCPVCNGKIKANRHDVGKWLCVSAGCSVVSVRTAVGLPVGFDASRKGRGSPYPELEYEYMTTYSTNSSIIAVDPLEYLTHRPYWVESGKDGITTYYRLGCFRKTRSKQDLMRDCEYVHRKDYIDRNGKHRKFVTGQYSGKLPPLFNQEFLQSKRGAVMWLEGEKSAFYFTFSTGLVGLSIPCQIGYSEETLAHYFDQIKKNVSGILYFPDNDDPGQEKAKKIQHYAQLNGIGTKILKPYSCREDFDEGDDVLEYLTLEGRDNLFNYIMGEL